MALNMETPMSFLHFYTILRIDKDLKLRKLGGCIKTLAIPLTITEVTCFAIITYKLDDYQNIYYIYYTVMLSKFIIHVYTTPTTHHMMPVVEKLKSELR